MKYLLLLYIVLFVGCSNGDRVIYFRIDDKTSDGYKAEYNQQTAFFVEITEIYKDGESVDSTIVLPELVWKYENMREIKTLTIKRNCEYTMTVASAQTKAAEFRFNYLPSYINQSDFLDEKNDTVIITLDERINENYNWPDYRMKKQESDE